MNFVFKVESELIDKLDILISDNKGDDEYRQLFNTMWVVLYLIKTNVFQSIFLLEILSPFQYCLQLI